MDNGRYRIAQDLRRRELESRAARAARDAGRRTCTRGDTSLAVNGVELRAPDNMYRLLDGTANRQTVHHGERAADDGRRATGDRHSGRERAGAAHARVGGAATVASSTRCRNGKLAYVYLPNTGQPGYTSFNRYYFAQQDRKGAVIDERYNGGGSAADYIVDLLGRDFDGYFNNPVGERVSVHEPRGRHLGPEGDDHQ